jgi:hypothetical protein
LFEALYLCLACIRGFLKAVPVIRTSIFLGFGINPNLAAHEADPM